MPVISTEAKRTGQTRGFLVAFAIAAANLFLSDFMSDAQQKAPKPMPVSEAKQFAFAATTAKQRNLPGFQLDPEGLRDGLYVFDGIWAGLPNGSVMVGFFAVDRITGSVWNPVLECHQIRTPALDSLQQRRRKQLELSIDQLRSFAANGPLCPDPTHVPQH